jgi:hypothetical protein
MRSAPKSAAACRAERPVVFGGVTLASLSSGGLMNCSGGSVQAGWQAVNLAMLPFLILGRGGADLAVAAPARDAVKGEAAPTGVWLTGSGGHMRYQRSPCPASAEGLPEQATPAAEFRQRSRWPPQPRAARRSRARSASRQGPAGPGRHRRPAPPCQPAVQGPAGQACTAAGRPSTKGWRPRASSSGTARRNPASPSPQP